MNFNDLILPVPRTAVFKMDGWLVWCGSMARGDDGIYYLYFSRWPKEHSHDAWVTHSEVGYATSENPLGPYTFKDIALKGSGGDNWDRDVIHNPTVIRINGRYYMYYVGNYGNREYWDHRNRQRIGVAIADHPAGPWKRFDKPVLDVTPGSHDHLVTSNPTVAQGPGGKIHMVYKAVGDGPLPKGGRVICGAAVAEDPLGPFIKQPEPIMINPENDWSVEDPFLWYQDDRFYALVKDLQGYFTKQGENTVALFESLDGIYWGPSEYPFAFAREIQWEDGHVQKLNALERPQLYLEDGKPKILFCAAAVNEERNVSFNVHIPLRRI